MFLSQVIVAMAIGIPNAMFAEAGLSFLGLGIPAPSASWGTNDRDVSIFHSHGVAFDAFFRRLFWL